MSELRGQITDVLQRVKYVKLGGDLDPLAGDILALIAEAMLGEEAVEAVARGLWIEGIGVDPNPVAWADAVRTCHPCVSDYRQNAQGTLAAALVAAGITGAGKEGGGDEQDARRSYRKRHWCRRVGVG